jgi:hypothetical protein
MEKSSGTSAIKVNFNVRNLKWEDVFGQISQAADQYESEGARGSKAEIKRTFRGICRNAPVIQQWLTLVPNGDYSSGIAGAFQMFAVVWYQLLSFVLLNPTKPIRNSQTNSIFLS